MAKDGRRSLAGAARADRGYMISSPGLADHDDVFLEQYGISRDGAVLVRPDGYVAWRSATGHAADGAPLMDAVARILARREASTP